jgi:hypothetical protein
MAPHVTALSRQLAAIPSAALAPADCYAQVVLACSWHGPQID